MRNLEENAELVCIMSLRGSVSTPKNHSVKHNQSGSGDSLLLRATDFWISSLEIINNPDRGREKRHNGLPNKKSLQRLIQLFSAAETEVCFDTNVWRFILWIFVACGE